MLEQGPIIVTLDGSELAEGALPYATKLAAALHTHLVLVTVSEATEGELGARFPDLKLDIDQSADAYFQTYLERVRDRLQQPEARIIVLGGDATEQILNAANETGARMIVMATHGRSGLRRWGYGSQLSKMAASSPVPVLAVGPQILEGKGAAELRRILVPLDGSKFAEAALPAARTLADALGAHVVLLRVQPWAATTYPYVASATYTPAIDDALEDEARIYLLQQVKAFSPPAEMRVARGDPAAAIIDLVNSAGVDLIVMSTHARQGLFRAALGSVADRVIQANAPVLLIRPE
ncbi:MAG TPA: universal stress protein [Dehalococcoidia bacterium]|nr:universal stress protein [Dehalococcoidia bacterium]